ncbi:MAG: hypothetical protein ACKVOE_04630 [Rickettsiales bacterium]
MNSGYSWRPAVDADYEIIKSWEATLRKQANWRGDQFQRTKFDDYLMRSQQEVPARHLQHMLLKDGVPVAYARCLLLKTASKRLFAGSTRVEETIYAPGNLSLRSGTPEALYEVIYDEAKKGGASLVYTELSVGLSPQETQRYGRKAAKGDAHAAQLLAKDFHGATVKFATGVGLQPLGTASAIDPNDTHAPYLRLVHVLKRTQAALPHFSRDGFEYTPYGNGHWLEQASDPTQGKSR